MSVTEKSYGPALAVLGGFAGFVAVGAAATALIYDPNTRAHWLRVAVAAVVGAGTGAYLGHTRQQFILDCAAPVVSALAAIHRAMGLDRDRLRSILQLLLAGVMIAAWVFFIVLPDWRLHRLMEQLQSPGPAKYWRAAEELREWDCGGFTSLVAERNRQLVDLLTHENGEVRLRARDLVSEFKLSIAAAVPGLVELLDDPDEEVRDYATIILTRGSKNAASAVPMLVQLLQDRNSLGRANVAHVLCAFGPAARDAVPELARLVSDEDADCHWWAIAALGEIHSNPEVSVPALLDVYTRNDASLSASASRALAEFGPQAAAAIPILERELKCGDNARQYGAWWALGKIEPRNLRPYPAER